MGARKWGNSGRWEPIQADTRQKASEAGAIVD